MSGRSHLRFPRSLVSLAVIALAALGVLLMRADTIAVSLSAALCAGALEIAFFRNRLTAHHGPAEPEMIQTTLIRGLLCAGLSLGAGLLTLRWDVGLAIAAASLPVSASVYRVGWLSLQPENDQDRVKLLVDDGCRKSGNRLPRRSRRRHYATLTEIAATRAAQPFQADIPSTEFDMTSVLFHQTIRSQARPPIEF